MDQWEESTLEEILERMNQCNKVFLYYNMQSFKPNHPYPANPLCVKQWKFLASKIFDVGFFKNLVKYR